MGNLLARIWANIKLDRGRCMECKAALRDDDPMNGVCSRSCADAYVDGMAY